MPHSWQSFRLSAQPNKASDHKQQIRQNEKSVSVDADAKDKQASSQANQAKASSDPPAGDAPFKWPEWMHDSNWWLVIVAIGTAGAIGWQANETRKAARGAQRAADASFAQIDLMKVKERARVRINAKWPEIRRVGREFYALTGSLEVRNIGQSKAYVINSAARLLIAEQRDPLLPELDDFWDMGIRDDVIEPSAPPACIEFRVDDNLPELRVFTKDVFEGRLFIRLYGFIEYETVATKYRNEFSYIWTVVDPQKSVAKVMTGFASPRDEESIPEGWWSESPKEKNGESQNPN